MNTFFAEIGEQIGPWEHAGVDSTQQSPEPFSHGPTPGDVKHNAPKKVNSHDTGLRSQSFEEHGSPQHPKRKLPRQADPVKQREHAISASTWPQKNRASRVLDAGPPNTAGPNLAAAFGAIDGHSKPVLCVARRLCRIGTEPRCLITPRLVDLEDIDGGDDGCVSPRNTMGRRVFAAPPQRVLGTMGSISARNLYESLDQSAWYQRTKQWRLHGQSYSGVDSIPSEFSSSLQSARERAAEALRRSQPPQTAAAETTKGMEQRNGGMFRWRRNEKLAPDRTFVIELERSLAVLGGRGRDSSSCLDSPRRSYPDESRNRDLRKGPVALDERPVPESTSVPRAQKGKDPSRTDPAVLQQHVLLLRRLVLDCFENSGDRQGKGFWEGLQSGPWPSPLAHSLLCIAWDRVGGKVDAVPGWLLPDLAPKALIACNGSRLADILAKLLDRGIEEWWEHDALVQSLRNRTATSERHGKLSQNLHSRQCTQGLLKTQVSTIVLIRALLSTHFVLFLISTPSPLVQQFDIPKLQERVRRCWAKTTLLLEENLHILDLPGSSSIFPSIAVCEPQCPML